MRDGTPSENQDAFGRTKSRARKKDQDGKLSSEHALGGLSGNRASISVKQIQTNSQIQENGLEVCLTNTASATTAIAMEIQMY